MQKWLKERETSLCQSDSAAGLKVNKYGGSAPCSTISGVTGGVRDQRMSVMETK